MRRNEFSVFYVRLIVINNDILFRLNWKKFRFLNPDKQMLFQF